VRIVLQENQRHFTYKLRQRVFSVCGVPVSGLAGTRLGAPKAENSHQLVCARAEVGCTQDASTVGAMRRRG
jgi:hypothetical protein